MKLKLVITSIVSAVLLLGCCLYYSEAFSASNQEYRIFVGGLPSKEISSKKSAYQLERMEMLKNKSEEVPDEIIRATVTFNDFLSPSEAQQLVDRYPGIEIERVWYWIPGETGRAMSQVFDRNIKESIDEAIQRFKETNPNDESQEIIDRLDNDLGVFSITVKGKYMDLEALSNEKVIKLIDVHYKETIEKNAKETGGKVRYIELPEKPDGSR
ncbi:hypothetical protein [Thermoactinomyces vulgaris]|jgi:uncharacterized membrane-anchored protein YjiN (DUF445 family)|uniref:hypothetical protein n=1 Tax=Thermoactinomyces vulgaris TaxID=2026 RepID=UPI00110781CF|nr:hypothetical protein [Thermoactinomyces vulgaris]QCV56246.1 hypothetical protein FA954_11835 [Thermoactinomyces vulgaris]